MVHCLSAQAQAIWPREREIFLRYGAPVRIADIGCGTGEVAERLLDLWPGATLTGIDLDAAHLDRARARCRGDFRRADVFRSGLEDASFDLVVCRHLTQAVPNAEKLCAELVRIVAPGGRLHVIAEDYAMIHFEGFDAERFFRDGPVVYGRKLGCDLLSGRRVVGALHALGVHDIRLDYITVDTERVPRATFAAIWEAWRDGYAEAIEAKSGLPGVRESWQRMIDLLMDGKSYAVWQVPVVGGVKAA